MTQSRLSELVVCNKPLQRLTFTTFICIFPRLNNANIEEINGAVFSKLTSLRTLDLSGNALKDLPTDLLLKNLELLDLSDNNLTSVSFIGQFPNLKDIYLQGNTVINVSIVVWRLEYELMQALSNVSFNM